MTKMSDCQPKFELPAAYRICISGYLDQRWSDRVGGMTVASVDRVDGSEVTTLFGCLPDQAALLGVLNTLYSLHLSVLLVEYTGGENIC